MASMKLLKMDALGRVRTPKAKREEILDEFEGSGLGGAELAGIKNPTSAKGRLADGSLIGVAKI